MIQRPAERVAAHGLHGGMAVLARREAGTDADDAGRVRDARAEILFGQNGVDDDIPGAGPCGTSPPGSARTGELSRGQNGGGVLRCGAEAGRDVLDRHAAVDDGLRKADGPPDGGRLPEDPS